MTSTGSRPIVPPPRGREMPEIKAEAATSARSRTKECKPTPQGDKIVYETRNRFLLEMLKIVSGPTAKHPGKTFDPPFALAVATAVDDDGGIHKLISQSRSNDLDSRLRHLLEDEEFIGGPHHAERNISLRYHYPDWLLCQPIAVTRPICPLCEIAIALRRMHVVGHVLPDTPGFTRGVKAGHWPMAFPVRGIGRD